MLIRWCGGRTSNIFLVKCHYAQNIYSKVGEMVDLKRDKITRQNSLDLLRIMATIAVIFIHVNCHYFQNNYDNPICSGIYVLESFINIIMRFSVPAFVMISGAFNLHNKKILMQEIFIKKQFGEYIYQQ